EAVHDLRVATRRLLALIQVLNSISPRPNLKKLMRAFKGQLDGFDKLRDTQVILAEVAEILPQLPQLQPFQVYLQELEKGLLKTLCKKQKVIDLYDVSKRIHRLQASLKTESDDNPIVPLLQAVDDAFLITQQRQRWINPAAATTIHRVRLAFKTFRYMVEVIHPLFYDFPPENLKRMHEYQSRMGEIQDAEVILQALAEAPRDIFSFDSEPVRRYYERCHAEAIPA
ncbi:MAG TPA: CHAD domain-containing protein, partial [Anaerolineales bacterium]|nr:CHAD domain-containing protein [Anaerolineales bacterium]